MVTGGAGAMGTLDEFERYRQTLCERLGHAGRQRDFIEIQPGTHAAD